MPHFLYTVACDSNENLIKANDAEKGNEFYCPICKNKVTLKKSGNTGPRSKRPHFAHLALTPNCSPETALHYSFKHMLADKIRYHLVEKQPLPFSWACIFCDEYHYGDLLKKVRSVKVEYNMKNCQPDIALLDENNNVFAVIEVIVTHQPEENALLYYENNNIILIEIVLTSDEDLNKLDAKIEKPGRVNICYHPKCKQCGNYTEKSELVIIDGECWKCHSDIKVAVIREGGGTLGPDSFSFEQQAIARQKGVILKVHYSETMNNRYLANTCPSCKTFTGNFFLFTGYYSPAMMGDYRYEVAQVSYYCERCREKRWSNV